MNPEFPQRIYFGFERSCFCRILEVRDIGRVLKDVVRNIHFKFQKGYITRVF